MVLEIYDLSFDPRDPLYDVPGLPGVRWGVQIFTVSNLYQLDSAQVTVSADGRRLEAAGLSWAGQQQRSPGSVSVQISEDAGATVWRIQAQHAEPIKVVKLMLWGLPESAIAQGWWQPTSTAGRTAVPTLTAPVKWNYPWREWLTPWACAGEIDGSPLVCVSLRDAEVRAKRLYTHLPPYADSKPVVEVIFEEDAIRWGNTISTCELRLRVTNSLAEVEDDFAAHLAFLEGAYDLQSWETRSDVPGWMRDIKLVLNLHGQHWTGYVFNTFDQMAETLKTVAQHVPGKHILAYVPGFEGRYYFAYPHYQPGAALGGEAGFRRLVDTANGLGVRLMPMFGMHGANIQVYPDYERSAFRSRTSSYLTLVNCPDWDTDRSGEDDQVFLNPGEPVFRQHLLEQVSGIVQKYGVSGVFLDTSACWFNDPRHNLYEGYRQLVGELHQRHPDVLVAGEGWYDALLAVLPVNQSWLGVDRSYKFPQLLAKYGRALGHLAEGAPGAVSTGVHERGFTYKHAGKVTVGHIPSVGIVDDSLSKYADDVIAACKAALEI
ncbi:hypothetical protein [Candidatus Flexifilum breve]|uniref:hypothetical protein n=1 Tax=Candidatus Flexifilum breve TaxID=3140694 RepID=UPI0031CCD6C6